MEKEKANPFMLYEVMNAIQDSKLAVEYAAYLNTIDCNLEAIANQKGMKKEFITLKSKALARFGWSNGRN